MGLTTDPNDECLDVIEPSGMQKCYLILSDEERAKGFVRPVRQTYIHIGPAGPRFPLADLTEEQQLAHGGYGYVKYEKYLESDGSSAIGRFWKQEDLDRIGKCGAETTMALKLAETTARDPHFYGGTFCAHCGKHFRTGPPEQGGEFVWADDPTQYVGT